ncbi:MAG: FeoC-like transcriptional regulator [Rhodospirillales bacterium]|nr:FeoC-like transcriptional regulator [Rhodospirillales bacterium]
MILSELRDYLAETGRAPVAGLAHRFGIDEPALRGMLAVWESKNKVRIVKTDTNCDDGCTACPLGSCEICEWIGN